MAESEDRARSAPARSQRPADRPDGADTKPSIRGAPGSKEEGGERHEHNPLSGMLLLDAGSHAVQRLLARQKPPEENIRLMWCVATPALRASFASGDELPHVRTRRTRSPIPAGKTSRLDAAGRRHACWGNGCFAYGLKSQGREAGVTPVNMLHATLCACMFLDV